ncbi:class I SAM-dependent methyltransferase [Glaciibacter sp. 2TAF33]|uniref:class I SAM-dependent methyltransferase n=1 Tax=Glaciibacter sp. 2TAF33 TaxID=3233015 RepID=UPI003F93AB31
MTEFPTVLEPTSGASTVNSEPWISDVSYWMPRHVVDSAWLEHAPFAYWLVDAIRPASIVELGTHNGFSYFVFCEAIRRLGLRTKAFALDSWEGDDQAGFYGEDVFESVTAINSAEYSSFSRLLRGYFDDSLGSIPDASVDLLHIDGRHGYDDVRHDFEAWLPKLTDRGVVIFHDIAEHQEGFGVWQFWAEVSRQFPSFDFTHNHGLGVLAVGTDVPERLQSLVDASADHRDDIRAAYEALGAAVTRQHALEAALSEAASLRGELEKAQHEVAARDQSLVGLGAEINELRQSTSWKVTGPLRKASDVIHGRRG